MTADEIRRQLLQFLDEHAFNPVLAASVERADRREALEDAQCRSMRLRRRYHEAYRTPAEIRWRFLLDVRETSTKLDRELERLALPTLPSIERAFLALCDALGVDEERHAIMW